MSKDNENNDSIMFVVCGGVLFYLYDTDIVNHDTEAFVITVNRAYTVDMQLIGISTPGGTIPQMVNIVNQFESVALIYDGIGYLPSNSGIIKAIKEAATGIMLH